MYVLLLASTARLLERLAVSLAPTPPPILTLTRPIAAPDYPPARSPARPPCSPASTGQHQCAVPAQRPGGAQARRVIPHAGPHDRCAVLCAVSQSSSVPALTRPHPSQHSRISHQPRLNHPLVPPPPRTCRAQRRHRRNRQRVGAGGRGAARPRGRRPLRQERRQRPLRARLCQAHPRSRPRRRARRWRGQGWVHWLARGRLSLLEMLEEGCWVPLWCTHLPYTPLTPHR